MLTLLSGWAEIHDKPLLWSANRLQPGRRGPGWGAVGTADVGGRAAWCVALPARPPPRPRPPARPGSERFYTTLRHCRCRASFFSSRPRQRTCRTGRRQDSPRCVCAFCSRGAHVPRLQSFFFGAACDIDLTYTDEESLTRVEVAKEGNKGTDVNWPALPLALPLARGVANGVRLFVAVPAPPPAPHRQRCNRV